MTGFFHAVKEKIQKTLVKCGFYVLCPNISPMIASKTLQNSIVSCQTKKGIADCPCWKLKSKPVRSAIGR
jgi:hypothetical protein